MDKEKIEAGIRLILEGIGENCQREGLKETPERVARMYEEIFAGYHDDAKIHLSKTFNAENNEMVIEKDITFYSCCEHHILPFFGKAHIAYIPNGKVVGISKLARCVEVYAKRLQIQEQMTAQIAQAIMTELSPKGVIVAIEAEHTCMTMRGVKKPGSKTFTYCCKGEFEKNCELRSQFFSIIK
ncbi:MAG: GTP cyclohydrolase I FolE [Oscillospiraceae bacterium]|nr:GTP cyclohydrolase I FolE [Oscillospiraceae bacterium]